MYKSGRGERLDPSTPPSPDASSICKDLQTVVEGDSARTGGPTVSVGFRAGRKEMDHGNHRFWKRRSVSVPAQLRRDASQRAASESTPVSSFQCCGESPPGGRANASVHWSLLALKLAETRYHLRRQDVEQQDQCPAYRIAASADCPKPTNQPLLPSSLPLVLGFPTHSFISRRQRETAGTLTPGLAAGR